MTLAQRIAQVLADMSIVAEGNTSKLDAMGGGKPGSRVPSLAGPPIHDDFFNHFERLCEVAEIALHRERGQDPFSGPLRAEERTERIIKALGGTDPSLAAYVARVSESHVRDIRRRNGLDKWGERKSPATSGNRGD